MALWKSWCLTCLAKASTAPSTTILLITVSTNTGTQYEAYTKTSTASSTSLENENPYRVEKSSRHVSMVAKKLDLNKSSMAAMSISA